MVTTPDHPVGTGDETREENEGGRIVPFPSGGRDGPWQGQARWVFTTEVRGIGGAEGQWLRHELAGVVRDLLTWARDDLTGSGIDDEGEKRAA